MNDFVPASVFVAIGTGVIIAGLITRKRMIGFGAKSGATTALFLFMTVVGLFLAIVGLAGFLLMRTAL